MIKMKQENYAQKMKKMRCILFLNPFPANKNRRLTIGTTNTKYKRHIELKGNAAAPDPAASSNLCRYSVLYFILHLYLK